MARTVPRAAYPRASKDCDRLPVHAELPLGIHPGGRVAGKAEVYVCNYDGFLIRYTRWSQGYDRYGYLNATNQVRGVRWEVGNELAGRQWTSYEDSPSEDEPYQWSAAYQDHPYSLSVEAISPAARQRGLAKVEVAPPSHIGLR